MSRPLSLSGARPLIKQRVWDLPTRLFHWSLVLLIGLSWWSAEAHLDELHLWLGYGALFLVLFRLGWGLVGSSTARFSAFVRGPRDVLAYVRHRFRWPVAGHSPLGALSVLGLILMVAVQVGTGLIALDEDGLTGGPLTHLVSISTGEIAYELHEELFNVLLALIGLHVAAILLYRLALGRNLLGPMISGKADLPPGMEPMRPVPAPVAILCALVALALTAWVIAGAPPL